MFSSLSRQCQSPLLRRVARINLTPLSSAAFSSSSIAAAGLRPTAVPNHISTFSVSSNGFARIPAACRLFSAFSVHRETASLAVKSEPMDFPPPGMEGSFPPGSGVVEATRITTTQKVARVKNPLTVDLVKFQDLLHHELIDKRVMKSILEDLKFENMTEVQSKTIRETLKGADVLAQARTGTGKTIAFLLPVLQKMLAHANPPQKRNLDIRSIIISPTRELANQITKEAKALTAYTSHIQIHAAVGGTGKTQSLRAMHREGCHILVATPGRLKDLLTDPASGIHTRNLETLVLDEADNLLDQGFAEAVFEIIDLLPAKEKRQTLLFSATIPDKVNQMIKRALKKEHSVLKMVSKGDKPTHHKVEQRFICTAGFENLLPTLYEQMKKEIAAIAAAAEKQGNAATPFKAIVFFPTAKFASLAAQTFMRMTDPETNKNPFHPGRLIEIHSRLTQSARDRAAKQFREAKSGILFSSDVTARGMDFPNVTHVFQVGEPRNLEQYVHRLGRTARGNSDSGLGYLIIAEFEKRHCLRELGSIKFKDYAKESAVAGLNMGEESVLPKTAGDALTRVLEATRSVDQKLKKGVYLANLGYYSGVGEKKALVSALNRWALLGWGMEQPPKVSSKLASKMGLNASSGVLIGFDEYDDGNDRMGGGGGGRGFSRGVSTFARGGDRGGFSRGGDRGSFKSRGDSEEGFRPRDKEFTPRNRDNGEFKPRGEYTPREDGFKPRGDREGFAPREGGFKPRGDREGFTPRGEAREGGFRPRGDREGFTPRGEGREGGFRPRGDREGFTPRGESRDGGFRPRGDREGFTPRGEGRDGGFRPRGDREGFAPREGGFKPRGDREGFTPRGEGREGGFRPRGEYTPREGGFREGGFRSREGNNREGGFKPRGDREGSSRGSFNRKPAQPWEGRGAQNSKTYTPRRGFGSSSSPGKTFN